MQIGAVLEPLLQTIFYNGKLTSAGTDLYVNTKKGNPPEFGRIDGNFRKGGETPGDFESMREGGSE
jgi:hypothetical protein